MRYVLFFIAAILCFAQGATAEDGPITATEIVQREKKMCTDFNDGKFDSTEQTITLYDFTGDGRPETIVDASQFSCSTSLTMWGGTGGTLLWVVVDGKPYEFLAHGWKVVDMDGTNVLLLAVHPSQCSDNVVPCYRAYVWSNGAFHTTR